MASPNLRWFCAPLLLISALATAQDSPALPPVFTPYTVLFDERIETPRGTGACVAGFVEAICSTGGTNECFGYKEDDDNYYMQVRSTGYYCGEWEESNNQLLDPPESIGLTDEDNETIDDLLSDLDIKIRDLESNISNLKFTGESQFGSARWQGHLDGILAKLRVTVRNLRDISVISTGQLSDLRDYTARIDNYYQSIVASNDVALDTNLKINQLTDVVNSEIFRLESVSQGLADDVARVESKLNDLNFDDETGIQDILDSIDSLESNYQSLSGGLNYAFERISTIQTQIYDSMNSRFSAVNDRFSDVYSDVFSEVGNIYNYINDEVSAVSASGADVLSDAQLYTDGEISSLSAAIDAGNADIASSIDLQTGEITDVIDGQTGDIVGAIDGQTTTLGSKLDGISFNLFDFSGKFDSFSDYIKGKIAGFEDSMTDGLPSDADIDSQTGELSSLIEDKDFARSYSIEFGAKQCPEPISVYMSTLKRDIEISFELFCQFADIARLFVLASAYIMALMITMGVSRRA